MKKLVVIAALAAASAGAVSAQPKSSTARRPVTKKPSVSKPGAAIPAAVPVKQGTEPFDGMGRTYRNEEFGFELTFPITWLIPGDDFESEMKKAGFDLSLSPPPNASAVDSIRMKKALEKVRVLMTAYRSMPGSEDNAIVRVSAEDLSGSPRIKDAVDYFDAMRSQFAGMKLPPDFKYSETGAEKLGSHQFGYIDTSSAAGKKRLYATVRNGHALLFSISYTKNEDLQVLRNVLSEANFALK